MLALIPLAFTYAAVLLSSLVFFYYGFYYGVYRPTRLFLWLGYRLCYYAILAAGLYFIFVQLYPHFSPDSPNQSIANGNNNESTSTSNGDNNESTSTSTTKDGNSLRTAVADYSDVLLQLAKWAVKTVARVVVAVLD